MTWSANKLCGDLTPYLPCGVQGFLAASPDGLVGRDGLVEVKCPLRCAEMSVAELTRQDNSFCLQVTHAEISTPQRKSSLCEFPAFFFSALTRFDVIFNKRFEDFFLRTVRGENSFSSRCFSTSCIPFDFYKSIIFLRLNLRQNYKFLVFLLVFDFDWHENVRVSLIKLILIVNENQTFQSA